MFRHHSVKLIVRAGLIAALYFTLCVALPAISFGQIQFRIAEALVLLPWLMPEATVGLAVGCFLANMFFSPYGWLDAVIGTIATGVAAFLTSKCKKLPLAAVPPVILNAALIPLIWIFNGSDTLYYINMLSVLASETLVVFALALPFTHILKRTLPASFLE